MNFGSMQRDCGDPTVGGLLSVVIPTHNRARGLVEVINATCTDGCVGEVIVVDDHSTDATPEVIAGLAGADGRVRSLRLASNVGPTAARTRGVQEAVNAVVLCLDDDVVPSPGACEAHLAAHRRGCQVVAGGMPVALSPHDEETVRRYARLYNERILLWSERPDLVLATLWGGFVSFRRDVLLQATARCDQALRYHEDHELGLMLAELGCQGCYEPDALAEHRFRRSFKATLADNRASGAAYAAMAARYPQVTPPDERFAPELRRPWRALMLSWLSRSAPTAGLLAASALTEWIGRSTGRRRLAGLVLSAGCRAQYFAGYLEGSGVGSVRRWTQRATDTRTG